MFQRPLPYKYFEFVGLAFVLVATGWELLLERGVERIEFGVMMGSLTEQLRMIANSINTGQPMSQEQYSDFMRYYGEVYEPNVAGIDWIPATKFVLFVLGSGLMALAKLCEALGHSAELRRQKAVVSSDQGTEDSPPSLGSAKA